MSIVYFDVQIYEEKVSLLRTKNTCDKKVEFVLKKNKKI